MTTTPITGLFPGLVPGQAGSPGQSATSGSAGDAFLALVQGLLDDVSAQPAVDVVAATAAPNAEPAAAATTDVLANLLKPVIEDAPAAELPATPLPDFNAAAAAVVPVIAQAPPAVPTVDAPTAAASAVAAAPAATTPVAAAVAAAVAAPVAGAPATRPVSDSTAPAKADEPTTATSSTETTAPDAELPDVAVTRVEQRPAAAEQRSTSPAPTPAATVAPVSGPAPVSSTMAPVSTDTSQVTRQVFPEVVRVVNNPAGPQRVTIKLNPEALGEVRVVLTSRAGQLEVSLAAGTEARAALTDGASELTRLLDMVGRGDSRIVVRDLLGTLPGTTVSQPAAAPSGSGVPTDLAGGAGTGTGRPGGETATGQQSRNNADGSSNATDGTPVPTNPSRPTESVTRAHPGLDVTM